jgi:hypothetical protein
MGAANSIANIIGLIVGLAIIAVLAAKPQIIGTFFSGVSGAVTAAKA